MNDKVALDIIRTIAATMDKAVYWIISVAYEVIHDLAGVNIFSDSSNFSMRIYTLIGLFMIFRISFSMINYLINPDSITDKEKGGSNLIKRIVITFALIIFTPYGFNLLSEAQTAILGDNVLPKFFLGESYDTNGARQYKMDEDCSVVATAENDGQYIALLTLRPFFQLEESLTESEKQDFINYTSYCKSSSIGELLTMTTYNAPTSSNVGLSSGDYRVNYWFIISTIVGGAIAALMISFCMDVAVRSIKLSFLEIISPVPIISYMDPSQGKSGMFKKWLSEVGKTWADLFLRLGAIFFAVNIISSLENIWEEANLTDHKFWVFLFIIVGALIFAKKLPSLIENLLGIKLSGALSFNPLKKLSDEAIGGKYLAGVGYGAMGAAGGAIAGIKAGSAIGNIKRGALLGTLSGFANGFSDSKQPFFTGMNKTYKNLMGSDMANFSLTKAIANFGDAGDKSVGEMKAHLNTARDRLNNKQSELSHITAFNNETAVELGRRGINLDNIDGSLIEAKGKVDELNSKIESIRAEASIKSADVIAHNDIKQKIASGTASQQEIETFNSNKAKIEQYKDDLAGLRKAYTKTQKQLEEQQSIISSINDYKNSRNAEIDVRAQISKIEKEISTLSDEKKQRETFYHVDTSPKTSVEEAKKNNPKKS